MRKKNKLIDKKEEIEYNNVKEEKKLIDKKEEIGSYNIDKEIDKGYCVICFDTKTNTVCVPCGHMCMCFECSKKVKDVCPVCRSNTQILKTYLV